MWMEAGFEWQKSNNFETRLKEISSELFSMHLLLHVKLLVLSDQDLGHAYNTVQLNDLLWTNL